MFLQNLIQRYMAGKNSLTSPFIDRKDLSKAGQHPEILWIGCSDSRIIPERIMNAGPGELFVIRNVGNIVPPGPSASPETAAALTYAVHHLRVRHIIVCGHTDCGCIRTLCSDAPGGPESSVRRWIQYAAPARDRVLDRNVPRDFVLEETEKENIILQCGHLLTYPDVRRAVETRDLKIHGWLYDLLSGDLFFHDPDADSWKPAAVKSSVFATRRPGPA